MAIRESGIRLRVDGLSQFTADINRANQAANNFGSGAKSFQLGNGDPFAAFAGSADRSLGTVQAKFGALNSFTAGIFAGLGGALASSLISGATRAATAIPNLLKSAFSEAINLEQASADAFAISQPSAQQQAQLAKIAESAALNPNLQVSQAGALEAIDAALKANISAQQIAGGGIIEAIVSQQNALGGSFNDNARLIAKQLNDQAGAANQLSAQQLANQNVGTFRAGQFQSINDLLLAQAAAGGALKNLGVSQQQFNELLAVAGTTASGGSDAGTSVKAFINAAANASKEQAAAQSALGFNIADDQGQFNSALALSQQLSAARLNGINAIIETGGGTKEQQAELKRLNRAISSNLNTASNLEAGITGVNLSDEKRAAKIAQANAQAQAAKKQFDAMLGTVPALGQTAVKIKQSETEFAGLLFQAFGTDGGRFAAALAGMSEEEAQNVAAMIAGADALEVAAVKTNTVQSKLEAIGDIFTANISKIAKPSLAPLKDALNSVAKLGGAITPAFDVAGQVLFRVVSGPLSNFSKILDNITLGIGNFSSGFSRSISLSDIFDIGSGGFDITLSKDIINGGNKISLTFGDIFTFETGAGGTLLKLGDFFSFDTTGDKLQVRLGDLIQFDTGSLGGSSLSQLRIGQTLTNFIYGQGKVSLNVGRMLYFDFNPANFGGFATLDIGAFGRNLVSAFYKQGQFQLDVGRLLNISGGVTPSGAFTLTLNDRNFSIDPSAVISGLQNAFTRLRTAFDGIKAGYDVAGIEGALLVAGTLVRNAFSKLAGAVQSISLPDIASFIKQKLSAQFTAFSVALPDIAGSIRQRITAQFGAFDISLPDIASGVKSRLQAQFAAFSVTIPDIASSIKQRLSAQFTAFDISLPDIGATVKQKLEGMFSTGQNAFGNATGFSLDFSGFTTAINDFKNSLGGLAGFVPGLAGFAGALTVISAVKTEGLAGIGKNVSSVVSGLGLLSNPISALAAIPYVGTALGLATVFGAISVLNTIDTSKFSQITSDLSGAVTGILDFGTSLVDSFDAESFAGTANSFVTGFVDRISATISGVDTGAIATSALGFATSILNKLSAVFSDPNLGADIGASAAGLVGSLVNSLSGVFSDPQAFANFGEGAANLTLSIGGFVTSLVTSFGSELTKVDFGQLIENRALSFAGLATGISKAISDSLIDGIDEMLGTKLASPQQRFEAFIDALIGAIDRLPVLGELITTQEEANAQSAAVKATQAATGNKFLAPQTIEASSLQSKQPVTAAQPAEPPKTWTQTIQDAALGFAGTLANVAVNNLTSLPLPVATGGGNGLGFAGVGIVRLDASKVEVQGSAVKTPSGEPQVVFNEVQGSAVKTPSGEPQVVFNEVQGSAVKTPSGEPQVVFNQAAAVQEVIRRATQGQPVQGPITQAQSIAQNAQPVGGGSSLFGAQQQAAQPKATAAAPAGGGSGFLAPSLKVADAQLQQGVSTFSAALKAAGSSVRATTAGVKIPPFKWPVIAPVNLASKVSPYRWPESKGVDLSNYITPFPGWSAIVPFVNVPAIPPFPGWQAFVQTVTVQVPVTGGNTNPEDVYIDPGNGGEILPAGAVGQVEKSATVHKFGIDTQPIVESYQDGTDALIKTLEDMADPNKTASVRNYNINIYSVNGTSDILKTILTGNNVEKQVALLNSGASATGTTTPNYTDKDAILKLFTGGTGTISSPFGGRSSALNKGTTNDSPQVAALLQAPPQVTNNYYNTKNYNLSVYTYQSEASITDQFAYMEHLGAGL